jgi:activator of 2-hydroxyglutaryl-CoA dehydratase
VEISAQCTVFAESEIITYLSQKVPREDIIAGMHNALVARVIQMGVSADIEYRDDVLFTGGVAKNIGVVKAMEEQLGKKVIVPKDLGEDTPQLTAALGAAETARVKFEKAQGQGGSR